ncbi:hypothetical protein QJS10_CPB18g00578 [Acorus calamus]|uniref:Uncharacterized protein n=1 Tax=Acorus calamus TaxID=4465 RepID=A0AAV9CN61_ACOCL|nr:hypothetical protein QJS10_CPB18g00578 [Acorus calamus]
MNLDEVWHEGRKFKLKGDMSKKVKMSQRVLNVSEGSLWPAYLQVAMKAAYERLMLDYLWTSDTLIGLSYMIGDTKNKANN